MHAVPSPGRGPLRLMRRLNLFGLDFLDPIVLAALADERPLLLIGPHGTAKSELLNRLAATLGLEHRHGDIGIATIGAVGQIPLDGVEPELERMYFVEELLISKIMQFDVAGRCRCHQAGTFG